MFYGGDEHIDSKYITDHNKTSRKKIFMIVVAMVIVTIVLILLANYFTNKPLVSVGFADVLLNNKYKGCYKDAIPRALSSQLAHGVTKEECESMAKAGNYKYYGLQFRDGFPPGSGQSVCFAGNSGYDIYGPIDNCSKPGDADYNGFSLGSGWSNAVYEV